VYTQHSHSNI